MCAFSNNVVIHFMNISKEVMDHTLAMTSCMCVTCK